MREILLITLVVSMIISEPLGKINAADSSGNSIVEGYNIEVVAEGLDFPWSIAFLPNGDYLVARRLQEAAWNEELAPPEKGSGDPGRTDWESRGQAAR